MKSTQLFGSDAVDALLHVERWGYPRAIEFEESSTAFWFELGGGVWWANHRGEVGERRELCFHACLPPNVSGSYWARRFLGDLFQLGTDLGYDRLRVLRPIDPPVQSFMERLASRAWREDDEGFFVELKETRDGIRPKDPKDPL